MPAATHYVTAYTGKVQPHVTSLRFLCLVWMLILMRKPALLQLPRTPAASAQASCRRLLMHMASTCHKRRHRSMQEMVDFVLGFPEAICTRSFRRLYISGALAQAAAELQVDTAVGKLPRSFSVSGLVAPGPAQGHLHANHGASRVSRKCRSCRFSGQLSDYQHRGAPLREWCWYFYVAGVERVPAQARNQPEVFEFAAAHPHSRQWAQRVICRSAWRVPQLVGPTFPAADSDPERRALMFLVLFRPWLGPPASVLRSSEPNQHSSCSVDAWALYRCQLVQASAPLQFPMPNVPLHPLLPTGRAAFCTLLPISRLGLCRCPLTRQTSTATRTLQPAGLPHTVELHVLRDEGRVTTMCASLPIYPNLPLEATEGSFARNEVSFAIVARQDCSLSEVPEQRSRRLRMDTKVLHNRGHSG